MHGAHVVLACRNMRSAKDAVNAIKKERPAARVEAMFIDLTSLKTVEQFANNYVSQQLLVLPDFSFCRVFWLQTVQFVTDTVFLGCWFA
jgi:NAD(P)-dependent dehydrogenase (short-subunit alcohol dehydrogenase family)